MSDTQEEQPEVPQEAPKANGKSKTDLLMLELKKLEIPEKRLASIPFELKAMVAKSPKIANIDVGLLINTLVPLIRIGLCLDPAAEHVYVDGSWHAKTNTMMIKKIIMWKGLLYLASRNRAIKSIKADIAYTKDTLAIKSGSKPSVEHDYWVFDGRGEPHFAYAIMETTQGGVEVFGMNKEQLEAHAKEFATTDMAKMMWSKFPAQYWKKTVIKALLKNAPYYDGSEAEIGLMREDEDYTFEPITDDYVEPEPEPVKAGKPVASTKMEALLSSRPAKPTEEVTPIVEEGLIEL